MMRIAFVGLGAMGGAMAKVLLNAGFEVSGFDPSEQALADFASAGGAPAASPAAAAAGAEALVCMVVNADQAEQALLADGAIAALADGAVAVLTLTMPPARAERLCAQIEQAGRLPMDAPVSGGVAGAAAGELTIMAAGSDAARAKAAPLLDVLGKRVFDFGSNCGSGSTAKMVHQLAAGVNLAVAAEAMGFGARAGLDPQQLYDLINSSAGQSWMLENRGARMLAREFEPAKSAVDIFVKDLGIVLDGGERLNFPLPLAACARQLFMAASGSGLGREDDSALVKLYESWASEASKDDRD